MATSFLTTLLNLLKSIGTVFNLFVSVESTSAFRLARPDFAANLDVSTPVAFFKSNFVAQSDKLTLLLMSLPNGSYGLGKY